MTHTGDRQHRDATGSPHPRSTSPSLDGDRGLIRHLPGGPHEADRLAAPAGDPISDLTPEALHAWESSPFSDLAESREILQGASEIRVGSGDSIYRFDDPGKLILAIMVRGVARVYTGSPQGRQVTIRYVSEGDWLGLPLVLAPRIFSGGMALAVQALTSSHLLKLSVPTFRKFMSRDVSNMWSLIEELARSMATTNNMLAENVFLPIRSRVARHLLDLAQMEDGRWIVRASQQDIADAIGSVREVVSRAILSLRDEGLLHRDNTCYVLDHPAELHKVAVSESNSVPVV